jgi:uncharacterized membrane protein YgcG
MPQRQPGSIASQRAEILARVKAVADKPAAQEAAEKAFEEWCWAVLSAVVWAVLFLGGAYWYGLYSITRQQHWAVQVCVLLFCEFVAEANLNGLKSVFLRGVFICTKWFCIAYTVLGVLEEIGLPIPLPTVLQVYNGVRSQWLVVQLLLVLGLAVLTLLFSWAIFCPTWGLFFADLDDKRLSKIEKSLGITPDDPRRVLRKEELLEKMGLGPDTPPTLMVMDGAPGSPSSTSSRVAGLRSGGGGGGGGRAGGAGGRGSSAKKKRKKK